MDSRYFDYDHMPDSTPFNNMYKYSNKVDEIKESLHITKPDRFSKLNSTVASELGWDHTSNATWVFSELLDRGLKVMINVGQFDMKDGVRQTLAWTKNIEFDEREEFDRQARSKYVVEYNGEEIVGGYFR